MSQVAPCPPRPGAGSREMPGLFRFALVSILSLVCTVSLSVQSPQAQPIAAPVWIEPAYPCADQDVRLMFTYCTCNMSVLDTQRVLPLHERILVGVRDIHCVQCAPDTIAIPLGRFGTGHHRFVTEVTYLSGPPDSFFTQTDYFVTEFDVRPACNQAPLVPFLSVVNIGVDEPCDVCPPHVCAGDSVRVYLHGEFPTAGYRLVEATAMLDSLSPIPTSQVRLVYARACAGATVPTPWSAALAIAPMLHGSNGLLVTAYLRDDCRQTGPQWLGQQRFPIAVDDCPVRNGCYLASFGRQPDTCNAWIDPNNPAFMNLGINSDRAIGGAQGRLVFDRPGLHVQSIEAPYAGSILKWDRTAEGANFVLVVPRDSIPASPPDVFRPLLYVTVVNDGGPLIGQVVRLTPVDLLVSDANGQELPRCPLPPGFDPSARICSAISCDTNRDGRTDVRDLVVMVNCQEPPFRCAGPPDCDGDNDGDLDDVLCCARAILHGAPPDSVNAVPAPEVALAFGAPVAVDGGIDVPVTVSAIERVSATRLEFSYPDGAFASASIELTDHQPNWLTLHDAGGGKVVFGGIRLAPDVRIPEDPPGPMRLMLHLKTRSGQEPAGAVAFLRGDFSDADGATMVTSARPVTLPLGGGGNLALRAARPNPFGSQTHFGVGLAEAADLEVSIYDLAGRRVTTLFKGRAAAGTREFTWRRTRDDGSRVPSGMYFYRIVSGGELQGRKVLVLD